MSNFTGYGRGSTLGRELRDRDEREARWGLGRTGHTTCGHGVVHGEPCPDCGRAAAAQVAREQEAEEGARRLSACAVAELRDHPPLEVELEAALVAKCAEYDRMVGDVTPAVVAEISGLALCGWSPEEFLSRFRKPCARHRCEV